MVWVQVGEMGMRSPTQLGNWIIEIGFYVEGGDRVQLQAPLDDTVVVESFLVGTGR